MGNSYLFVTVFRNSPKVRELHLHTGSWCLLLLTFVIVTGKKISCAELGDEQYIAGFPVPRAVALDVLDGLHSLAEFGCKFYPHMAQALAANPRGWS